MIRGSCLCKGVRFEIDGELTPATNCHCAMCRKAHGAAFGTYAGFKSSQFRLLACAALIKRYPSSPGILRTFCANCGSTLQWLRASQPEEMDIALGTLDDDPGVRPAMHIFVGSKAPWHEIADALPQYKERKS